MILFRVSFYDALRVLSAAQDTGFVLLTNFSACLLSLQAHSDWWKDLRIRLLTCSVSALDPIWIFSAKFHEFQSFGLPRGVHKIDLAIAAII
ncbi:hypothetical protein K443DRAFT_213753 [Laccaria amethystina LaAM-08-1]|uniref:Uncharacterized protein n=1 Tax=Laccaria amethystina LaAM-08-1 TaxID=1095629 RepID=A0A0C9WZC2_9AGAR|nr:hypothetical protein K443DRAFT_213753 [Laccaria amethystina LaAM-08-1]